MQEHKELNTTFEFYDMSREEIMERSMKQFHYIHSHPEILKHHQSKSFTTLMMDYMQGQVAFNFCDPFVVPLRYQHIHVPHDHPKPRKR